jgi:hypothetical protein
MTMRISMDYLLRVWVGKEWGHFYSCPYDDDDDDDDNGKCTIFNKI